ncbi:MAG: hypothetical protein ACTHZ9_05150 [Leucobacter sp.]
MTTQTIRRSAALLAAAALTFTLASCAGGQSVADACTIANEAVTKVNSDVQSATQKFIQDSTEGGEADINAIFAPITEAMESAESEITNEEVAAALDKVSGEFDAITTTLEGFEMPDVSDIDPTDPEAMKELEDMQAQSEEMSATLTEQSQKLGEAGQNLQEVCSS